MTPNDPYVTFDPKPGTPPMKIGSVVLLTKFGPNRSKDVGAVGFSVCGLDQEEELEETMPVQYDP